MPFNLYSVFNGFKCGDIMSTMVNCQEEVDTAIMNTAKKIQEKLKVDLTPEDIKTLSYSVTLLSEAYKKIRE